MIGLLLTAMLAAPNSTESTIKHVATGAAVGAALMGVCQAATDEEHTGSCGVFSFVAPLAAYGVKECVYDAPKYGGGVCDLRDVGEGMAGVSAGVLIFVPLGD